MKKPERIQIDERDPNKKLWEWLLAGGKQEPANRDLYSRLAKNRGDEYWDNHSKAVTESHRQKREAWFTDKEVLTGTSDPE